MNYCWKCEREIPFGTECNDCTETAPKPITIDLESSRKVEFVELDWDKVVTLQDLKEIVRVLGIWEYMIKDSPEHRQLQRFLKTDPEGGSTAP